jgi:hypothetical protein
MGSLENDLNDYLSQSFTDDEPKEAGFDLCNAREGEFMETCKECDSFETCKSESNIDNKLEYLIEEKRTRNERFENINIDNNKLP